MAPSFGRSISFPMSPARAAAHHVRSVSLPSCRAAHNPLSSVRAWAAAADPTTTAPSAGLAHLDALHAALAELLLLPEARAALQGAAADCLLDGFLVLADAHGAFQEALVELKRHAAEAQAALRRHDLPRLASAARAQRRAEKDLARLASSVRAAARFPSQLLAGSAAEAEVGGVLAEAVAAVASASAAVFSAVESISSTATAAAASASSSKKTASGLISLVTIRSKAAAASSDEEKEMAALDKLEDLEECIAEMEAGSDKVFRSILHTRVALLNIHTQTC